jgi:hypothetical protein
MAGLLSVVARPRVRFLRLVILVVSILGLATQATEVTASASGVNATGGGSTTGMTRFALGVQNGTGHFECLMPGLMTVQATVHSAQLTGTDPETVTLSGIASVNLAEGNPFGLPAGPLVIYGVPLTFTATAVAGGPGTGFEDLKILGMDFPGTVVHGQINIGS